MAVRTADNRINDWRFRKAWPQTGVWPAAVVMRDPLPKNRANVPFVDRNDEIQAFATDRPDHALAERVRLWNAHWGFEHR